MVRCGERKEPIARQEVERVLGTTVEPSGLVISKEHPFLAASPEGLIGDDGLLEIKCPFTAAEHSVAVAVAEGSIKFCKIVDGVFILNKNHNYYYQVQGQLHVTNRKYCVFAVWTQKDLAYCKIEKDQKFWDEVLPKLERFYTNCLLPELVNIRHVRGLPIREL